jgi:hypothetical protein
MIPKYKMEIFSKKRQQFSNVWRKSLEINLHVRYLWESNDRALGAQARNVEFHEISFRGWTDLIIVRF